MSKAYFSKNNQLFSKTNKTRIKKQDKDKVDIEKEVAVQWFDKDNEKHCFCQDFCFIIVNISILIDFLWNNWI